jgi:outer membrane protein
VKLWQNASNVRCSKQLEKLSGTYDADYKKMVEEYQKIKKIRS